MELGIGFDDLNDVAALVDPEKNKPETCEVLLRHGTKEDVLEESKFCLIQGLIAIVARKVRFTLLSDSLRMLRLSIKTKQIIATTFF